jgi:hypothetical protein
MKSSFNSILENAVVGKKIAKQDSIHENYWGATIKSICPCDLNYGCDSGYLIGTDASGCNSFTIDGDFAIDLV